MVRRDHAGTGPPPVARLGHAIRYVDRGSAHGAPERPAEPGPRPAPCPPQSTCSCPPRGAPTRTPAAARTGRGRRPGRRRCAASPTPGGTGEPAGIRHGPSPRRWLGRPTHGRPARKTRAAALRCRPSGRCRPAATSRPGRPVLGRISETVAEPPGGSATGGSGPPMGASAQLNGVRARRSPKPGRSSVAPGRWRIKISSGRSEPAGGSVQVAVI
jgi:hypothetical protein